MQRNVVMKKQIAIDIQQRLLTVISELSSILLLEKNNFSEKEYEAIKKGVGISIGEIQVNLLDFLCSLYPEIDNLSDIAR